MSQPPPPPPSGDPQYPSYNPQQPQQPQQPQSPYGQQPGFQPYGQQYPPNPYGGGGAGPQKSHTTRNILIIVAVLVVLFCGGITTAIVLLVNSADDAFDSAFDTEYRGSENDPLEVAEGDSFSIRGFDYAEGWTIVEENADIGQFAIEGLKVTNNREDEESSTISLTFSFYSGGEGVGDMSCNSETTVRPEKTVRMTCQGYDLPPDYDSIEVNDNAYYE